MREGEGEEDIRLDGEKRAAEEKDFTPWGWTRWNGDGDGDGMGWDGEWDGMVNRRNDFTPTAQV